MSGMSPQPAPRDPSSNPYGQGPAPVGSPYGTPDPAAQAVYGRPDAAPAPHPGPAAPGTAWPAAAPAPVGSPVRPASIAAATWLILGAGLVTLASVVLGLVAVTMPEGRAQLTDALRETYGQAGIPQDQVATMLAMVDSALPALMAATAVIGLLVVLVYVLIALKIRGGSRGARTVGTVLAVLSVLLLVGTLASGAVDPLGILATLLGVAGIVMAHRGDATEFMRLKAWERAARRR